MEFNLDHIVIAAETLEAGVAYVKKELGIEMPFGGRHIKMGTHNHLMRIGQDIFLEIIAIDPDLPVPDQPRWFGLDDPYIRVQIRKNPILLTWVANTTDIKTFLSAAPLSFGRAELISRGDLSWYFSLPRDGRLIASGILPYVIEWQTPVHPSENMADLGCRLQQLEIRHPLPEWLKSMIGPVKLPKMVRIKAGSQDKPPSLAASFETPVGTRTLSSLM